MVTWARSGKVEARTRSFRSPYQPSFRTTFCSSVSVEIYSLEQWTHDDESSSGSPSFPWDERKTTWRVRQTLLLSCRRTLYCFPFRSDSDRTHEFLVHCVSVSWLLYFYEFSRVSTSSQRCHCSRPPTRSLPATLTPDENGGTTDPSSGLRNPRGSQVRQVCLPADVVLTGKDSGKVVPTTVIRGGSCYRVLTGARYNVLPTIVLHFPRT